MRSMRDGPSPPDPNARDCACCLQEVAPPPSAVVRYQGAPVCGWACLAHVVTGTLHLNSRSTGGR